MTEASANKKGLRQRFVKEMREFAIISCYLWICFSALLLYKASLTPGAQGQMLLLGTAAVKALVLGKFILIGQAFKAGTRISPSLLLYKILWKCLAVLLVLMVFTALEELIVGLVHGHAVVEIVAEVTARPWIQSVAPAVIMFLILIPLIAFQEVDQAIGPGTLRRTLFGRGGVEGE